jgi:hypothetical protein
METEMAFERRALRTLAEADKGKRPWRPWFLPPGEAEFRSKKELGQRSHQQKVERTRDRTVTFQTGIGHTRDFTIVASTDKQAIQRIRYVHKAPKTWKVVAVDGQPYSE